MVARGIAHDTSLADGTPIPGRLMLDWQVLIAEQRPRHAPVAASQVLLDQDTSAVAGPLPER